MMYAPHLARLSIVLLLAAWASQSCAALSPSVQELTVRPPRAAQPGSHRGFPGVVSVHAFVPPDTLSARVRQVLRLETPAMEVVDKNHVVDLLGGISKVGEYYTQIFLGGQPVRVQVDTGSSTMAVPMAECAKCLKTDLRYNMKLGDGRWISCTNKLCRPDMCSAHKCKHCSSRDACCSALNPSACGFKLKYGDGSYARGALVVDDMRWGDGIASQVVFGGILDDSPKFERGLVDGILGMAYKALACNPTCVEPPFQQMVAAGKVADSFAICVYGEGGKLVLGGMDPTITKGPMTYVPLALGKVPTYYAVNVSSTVGIGEREMRLPYFRKIIVDSGTTLLVLKVTAFAMLSQHLKTHYCHVPGLCARKSWFRPAACVPLTDAMIAKLPTLKFLIGDKDKFELLLPPEDYMIKYHHQGHLHSALRCVGIMAMKHLSHGHDAILGNTVMQRYVTHYDRKSKRVGFAEAKAGCGAPPKCRDLSTCVECADQKGCTFDFSKGICSKESDIGLIPYPRCSGASCMCSLGPHAGLLFGTVSGFVSTILVCAIALFVVVLYGRGVGGQRNQYSLTGDGEDEEEDEDEALFEQEGGDGLTKRTTGQANGT